MGSGYTSSDFFLPNGKLLKEAFVDPFTGQKPNDPLGQALIGIDSAALGAMGGGGGGFGSGGGLSSIPLVGSMLGGGSGSSGGALGSSLSLPGVSDSALADMMGSINPGAGTTTGIADAGPGSGKGTGLSGMMGSTGTSGSVVNSIPQLLSSGMDTFKPSSRSQAEPPPRPGEINPSKGPVQGPQLTPAQQKVGRPYGNVMGGGGEIQKLLQLLKGLK